MLHITSEQSVAKQIAESAIPGKAIAWIDVLYDGPVPAVLDLNQFSQVRTHYFTNYQPLISENLPDLIKQRNQLIGHFQQFKEIILWFGHNLSEQLHLLQLLHWLAAQDLSKTTVSMISVDRYLGKFPFYGYQALDALQLANLFGLQQEVTMSQWRVAIKAWQAFISPDPRQLVNLYQNDTSALPFLKGGLRRLFEQYPLNQNGTCRTEQEILKVLGNHSKSPWAIFEEVQQRETPRFMHAWLFWNYLNNLIDSAEPLLMVADEKPFLSPLCTPDSQDFHNMTIHITKAGRLVLYHHEDWLHMNGIDRWVGGVHLTRDNIWRWNASRKQLIHTYT